MRESIICKVEGDDEYYHMANSPGVVFNNTPPEYQEFYKECYCGKKIRSWPHEWIQHPWPLNTNEIFETDFTWKDLKPCKKCERIREQMERDYWHF